MTLTQRSSGPDEPSRNTISDIDGEFQFTGLANETFVLEARRTTETHSELARFPRAMPGRSPVQLRLADEDPKRRGKQ